MADSTKNVSIVIDAKDKASAALKNVSKEMDNVSKSQASINASSKGLDNSLSGLVSKFGPWAAGLFTVKKAYDVLSNAIGSSIDAYNDQQIAETKLISNLGYLSTGLTAYASELQKVSVYSDDATISAMSQLSAFTKNESTIKSLTVAAQDLATAKGIGLSEAMEKLIRTVISGDDALSRYGISIKGTKTEAQRLAVVTKGVHDRWGELNLALTKTNTGKVQQLKNEIDDLKKEGGKNLSELKTEWETFTAGLQKGGYSLLNMTAKGDQILLQLLKGTSLKEITAMRTVEEVYNRLPAKQASEGLKKEIIDVNKQLDETKKKLAGPGVSIFRAGQLTKDIEQLEKVKEIYLEARSVINKGEVERVRAGYEESNRKTEPTKGEPGGSKKDERLKLAQEVREEIKKLELSAMDDTYEGKIYRLRKEYEYELFQKQDLMIAGKLDQELYWKFRDALWEKKVKDEDELQGLAEKEKAEQAEKEWRKTGALHNDFEKKRNELSVKYYFTSHQDKMTLIKKEYEDDQIYYKKLLDTKVIFDDDYKAGMMLSELAYQEKLKEERINYFVDTTNAITDIASEAMNIVSMISDAVSESQLKRIDEETDARKKAARSNITNKKLQEKEIEKIDKEAQRKREEIAKREKRIAMVMSIINTAQGVTKAFADNAPPLSFVLAALVAAAGLAQTIIIGSQAFAQGGIIEGQSATGDQTAINANAGEMVITKQQQRNLLALANVPQHGGSNVVLHENIVVNGNMDSSALAELRAHREEALEWLRDSNKTLQYRGYTYAT